jgi:hypothetical protein
MVGVFTLGSRAETGANLLCSFPVASVLDGTEKAASVDGYPPKTQPFNIAADIEKLSSCA